ncbi:MAG: TIGR00725 family protein [Methanosarcina sp.]|nr:MAG: TIGR00725 family protein [Methanosarcina sp.]
MKPQVRKQIGVIGAGTCSSETRALAETVGKEIAKRGAVLLCGGLGGVMEAAACGAKLEGGITLGILPGVLREEANPWIDLAILSGMGHARNALIPQSSDALIAVSGEYGTLSEIALGLKMGKPVVLLESGWKIEGTESAKSPQEAVELAFRLIEEGTKIKIEKKYREEV